MPIPSFRLKSTIGRSYKTEFDDIVRAKEALRGLEYYETPPYGMTGYPDDALFNAIENFQNDNGLQRDGVMKPGGETERAIDALVAGNDNGVASDRAGAEQLAQMPIEAPPLGGTGIVGPVIGGAIGLGLMDRLNKRRQQNMGIVDPLPNATPPNEPPPSLDNKTETPASSPNVPSALVEPIASQREPNILIYPAPGNDLAEFGRTVERNETLKTKAEIDRIRDWFFETHNPDDWIQYGGRDRTGKDLKEYQIPGPAADFVGGDGRPGSRFVDLTFIHRETGQRIHIQTADVDKNGQIAPRERAAEEDIRRLEFLRSRDPSRSGSVQIFIIPKGAQLDRLRPIR